MARSDCKVFLYKNDYNTMCAEVYRHPRIETGGNLFGLWTTSGDVVVHAALGPGRDCKRTDVSFHQDIEYMKRVGHFLNEEFMLCHVGEWHSHHQLSLDEPSDGDKRTVWNNYPSGMKKFLVIIGNLVHEDTVKLSPYFFIGDGKKCRRATHVVLDVDSPFTTDSIIAKELLKGSEKQATDSMGRAPTGTSQQPASRDHFENDDQLRQNEKNSSNERVTNVRQNNDYATSFVNHVSISMTGTGSPTSQPSIPPPDYDTGYSMLQSSGTETSHNSANLLVTNNLASNKPSSTSQTETNNKQTRQEATIKKVYDMIKSHFGNQQIDLECAPSGSIEIKFKHNDRFWLIKFPQSFPKGPAKVYRSYAKNFSSVTTITPSRPMKPESLNNYVNILLTIQRDCSQMLLCSSCRTFSPQALVDTDSDLNLFLAPEANSTLEEFCRKITSTIVDTGSIKKEIDFGKNHLYNMEEPVVKISFKHALKTWIVRVTSSFPDCPAKATYIDDDVGCGRNERSFQLANNKSDFVSQILQAITQKCCCTKCKHVDI